MSQSLTRERFSAMACRVETTQGVDPMGGSPAGTDFVLGSASFRFNPNMVNDPSFSGGLDALPGIVGGLQPTIEVTVPLRGSGAPGTAPSWGALMRACTFEEVVTATAVGAPTAATAGTATTATLATPFVATAQAYRGMPAILSGNPATPVVSPIMDYTAGRVAAFGETFGSALNTSTLVQVPANVLYRPTSNEALYRTATIYLYGDDNLWIFVGCVGSVRLDLSSGEIGSLVFSMRGQFLSHAVGVTLPTALNATTALPPPRWAGGRARFLGLRSQMKALSFDAGVDITLPDDPEAAEGYGPGVPVGRGVRTTLDPLMDTTTQVALMNSFRSGASGAVFAQLGSTAGNRFTVAQPQVRMMANDPGARGGLRTNQVQAMANAVDASLFLSCF